MTTHTSSEFEVNKLTGTLFVDNTLGDAYTDLESIIHVSRKEECQLLLVFKGGESNRINFDSKYECERCFFDIKKSIKAKKRITFAVYKLPRLIIAAAIVSMAFSISHASFERDFSSTNEAMMKSMAINSSLSSKSSGYFDESIPKSTLYRLKNANVSGTPQADARQPVAREYLSNNAYRAAQVPQAVQAAQPQAPRISEAQLSAILNQANKTGRFTIPLNPAKVGPVLYVFADPNCPHCREIEPTLASLSSEYDVELFPVAVIGNADSKAKGESDGATAICAEDRVTMWRAKVGKTEIPPGVLNACPAGIVALKTNNEIYQVAGFVGTPSLVNAKGQQYPANLPFTREAIKSWLDSGVSD